MSGRGMQYVTTVLYQCLTLFVLAHAIIARLPKPVTPFNKLDRLDG